MAFKFTGFADEATKSLKGQIDVLKKVGWSAIETRLVEGKNFCDLSDAEFEAAWDTLQSAGIKIVGYGSQIANWGRPITTDFDVDINELERNIKRMRKTGTKFIRVMSYPNAKEPWPEDKWKAEVFRRLKELAARARAADIILVHENCNGYGGIGPKQTLEMLEQVDNPAFKLVFDTGNNTLHDHDHEATWKFYDAVKDHVVHVHIKAGKPGADGKYATCYPDEDPVQLKIVKDLKKRGYDGYLSIEPHLKAAVHAGKDVDDAAAATACWIDYAKRIEKLAARA
ncbi:MAG: sugar phosphate isomerase/epimerase [Planctomycetota bacterium]|nr:sugar phosphate isomerase/epimerase [Planctomycetota bacterium]